MVQAPVQTKHGGLCGVVPERCQGTLHPGPEAHERTGDSSRSGQNSIVSPLLLECSSDQEVVLRRLLLKSVHFNGDA